MNETNKMKPEERKQLEEMAEKHLDECAKCAGIQDRRFHKIDFISGAEAAYPMGYEAGVKAERERLAVVAKLHQDWAPLYLIINPPAPEVKE